MQDFYLNRNLNFRSVIYKPYLHNHTTWPELHNKYQYCWGRALEWQPLHLFTKASELNDNGACGSSSKDSKYELVRGRGASAKIELNFSNPLYAEPERVIACEIYESVSLFSTSRHVVDDMGTSYCTDKCFDQTFFFVLFRAILMLQV